MTLELSILELAEPKLQFGGALNVSQPKIGLEAAGTIRLEFRIRPKGRNMRWSCRTYRYGGPRWELD